jgi:hypothetical protein
MVGGKIEFTTPNGSIECIYAGNVKLPGTEVPTDMEDIIITRLSDTPTDEDGEHTPSIELYNNSTAPVNLQYWGISDDPTEPLKWQFPDVTIQPGEYMLVFASGKARPESADDPAPAELHTDFQINNQGGYLGLCRAAAAANIGGTKTNLSEASLATIIVGGLYKLTLGHPVIAGVGTLAGFTVAWYLKVKDGEVIYHTWNNKDAKTVILVIGSGGLVGKDEDGFDRELSSPAATFHRLGYNVIEVYANREDEVLKLLSKGDIFIYYGHTTANWMLFDWNLKSSTGGYLPEFFYFVTTDQGVNTITPGEIREARKGKAFDFVMLNGCSGAGANTYGGSRFENEKTFNSNAGDYYNKVWATAFGTENLIGWQAKVEQGFCNEFGAKYMEALESDPEFLKSWGEIYVDAYDDFKYKFLAMWPTIGWKKPLMYSE